MKKLLLLFMLVAALSFAGEATKTFDGTANDSADELPVDVGGVDQTLGFQAEYVCVHNLDADDKLYVKPCYSATCVANAGDANCTDGDGCDLWIVPPTKSYCYSVSGVVRLSTDMAATKEAAYIITAVGETQ